MMYCILLFLAVFTLVNGDLGRSACSDLNSYCPNWGQAGYCTDSTYADYMKKNCKKTCQLCGVCKDDHEHCDEWASYGYCTDPLYEDYMKDTCPKSCNSCEGPVPPTQAPTTQPPVTGGPQGSILKGCSFNGDTCDWLNVPFDDQQDFTITSESSGNNGPNTGMGGTGQYIYVSSSGTAQLLLPMELILNPGSNQGTICMTFGYYIAGSGTLYLKEIPVARNPQSKNLKVIGGNQGHQWHTAQVNVQASSDRQLMLEARPQNSPIAIDEIRFSNSRCV